MLNRRNFLSGLTALTAFAGLPAGEALAHHGKAKKFKVNPKYLPQTVRYKNRYKRGTIVVDARSRYLYQYAGGVPGGPNNPLGSRALYLYKGNRDTYYRIHGTTAPWTIGTASSNGCIRMINDHVADLYERVPIGATVVVL